MQEINNKQQLFHLLHNGAYVITPNNRLSNQWLYEWLQQQETRVHAKPLCIPYQVFLQHLYKNARHLYARKKHPIVLSPLQEYYIWQDLLHRETPSYSEGLLHEVQEAWSRCQEWLLDFSHPSFRDNPQTLQFQHWCEQFQNKIQNIGAISQVELAKHLLHYPELFRLNTSIVWACFDRFTPMQQALQQAIAEANNEQYYYDLMPQNSQKLHYPACDTKDEYEQMLEWIQEQQKQGKKKIAVVIPDLSKQSTTLLRYIQKHIPEDAFNLSLGKPFDEYPIIAHALALLQIQEEQLSHENIELLLRSPYIQGSKTEFIKRAEIHLECALVQKTKVSFQEFIHSMREKAPVLAECLHNLLPYPQEASWTSWIHHFKTRLHLLGFPGEYALNSENYQYVQRLLSLFEELIPLSLIRTQWTQKEALQAIHILAKQTIFQIKKPSTSLQFLGLLEASGGNYDCMWVLGLNNESLPAKTRLSAFIPRAMQIEKSMPHSNPKHELALAKQLINRLQNGCDEIVFSYPKLCKDIPGLPSPLIRDYPQYTAKKLQKIVSPSQCIAHVEEYHIPLLQHEVLKGGTNLLAYQAQCPFKAFSAYRLHATEPLVTEETLTASERGALMHSTLEHLWRTLRSQQKLLALNEREVHAEVQKAIQHALQDCKKNDLPQFVQELEKERLSRLVYANLAWEKERPSFYVESVEQSFTIELEGIPFHVRIDRLDSVDGKKWVIDYKTRLPSTKPWYEERPEAPQLLLYALLDKDINTLVFAELRAGNITISGLSEMNTALSGIQHLKEHESWENIQEQWKEQLRILVSEIRIGLCLPSPQRSNLCQSCSYLELCRHSQE